MDLKNYPKIILLLPIFILGLFSFVISVEGATGVPKILNYQGRLLNSDGDLLGGTGTDYCFKFSIYDDATVGAPDTKLWPTGSPSTMTSNVKNGVFNAGIGDTTAGGDTLDFNFQDNDTIYLNVETATMVGATCAAGDGAESFENLAPRRRIVSTGFAINASTLLGLTPYEYASSTQIPVLSNGNLNLGAASPQINATGTNTLTFQGNGGTGNIQFFSASNTLTSAGALTLAGGITSTGLTINTLNQGSLLFAGSGGALSQSSTVLYWDNVNGRLGIGNNAPSSTLHVSGGLSVTDPTINGVLYTNSSNLLTALASSTAGKVLTATGTAPYFSWETVSGTGITSLNGLTGVTQTFATSSETNVGIKIVSSGTTHTFTPIWIGTLGVDRGGTGT
ncbi:MAG: hypothetical protein Q8P66_02865, partial [Candidatus Colwellbacteria bacterium]|nr:hypothetical protein [Candidatus Colwellbacteria bacterium]